MEKYTTSSKTALISGFYGAMNIGDEAILYGAIHSISEEFSKIIVSSVNPERTSEIHGVKAIPTFTEDLSNWISELLKVDELIIGGGGLLEPKNTAKYSLMVSLAVLTQTKVSWYCVGVSPPSNQLDQSLYKAIVEASSFISVRDPGSKKELYEAGVSSDISIIPDPAFQSKALPTIKVNTPPSYICVVLRNYERNQIDTETLAMALDRIVRETETPILFTPFEDRDDDWETVRKAHNQMAESSQIYGGEIDVGHANYLIKKSELVIGMRLHSIILAAANGVPSVTLSYAEKCNRISSQIYDDHVLDCSQFVEDELVERAIGRFNTDQELSTKTSALKQDAGILPSNREYKSPTALEKLNLALFTIIALFNWVVKYRWRSN